MQGVLTGQQEVNDAMTAEERARAVAVLEKEFGPQWQTIVQMLGTENLRRRYDIPYLYRIRFRYSYPFLVGKGSFLQRYGT